MRLVRILSLTVAPAAVAYGFYETLRELLVSPAVAGFFATAAGVLILLIMLLYWELQ